MKNRNMNVWMLAALAILTVCAALWVSRSVRGRAAEADLAAVSVEENRGERGQIRSFRAKPRPIFAKTAGYARLVNSGSVAR